MTEGHPFHVLLPEQSPVLRRRALKLTQNPHRADDLVQTTLMKAWARRDSFQPQTNLRAWLFTILRNTFYSELRKFRREVQDVDGIRAAALYEEPRQDHAMALKELMAAVDLLPSDQRRALILMGAYGFSQLEAAHACGCTVGTIKSRVSRGRHALCDAIGYDAGAQRRVVRGGERRVPDSVSATTASASVARRATAAHSRAAPQTALDMRRDATGALRPVADVADLLHATRGPVLRAANLDDLRTLVSQLEGAIVVALPVRTGGSPPMVRTARHNDALCRARDELRAREDAWPARGAVAFSENRHLAISQRASWGWAFPPSE
nr:sigma-70 family RNA polymerase sigma factor [Roseicitreum antarcticum]